MDKWGWVPKFVFKNRMSGKWSSIARVGNESIKRGRIFASGVGYLVREERRVLFWVDDCSGIGPLCVLFPRVFRVVSNKKSSVSDYFVWGQGNGSWCLSFRRVLHRFKESQYGEFACFL